MSPFLTWSISFYSCCHLALSLPSALKDSWGEHLDIFEKAKARVLSILPNTWPSSHALMALWGQGIVGLMQCNFIKQLPIFFCLDMKRFEDSLLDISSLCCGCLLCGLAPRALSCDVGAVSHHSSPFSVIDASWPSTHTNVNNKLNYVGKQRTVINSFHPPKVIHIYETLWWRPYWKEYLLCP